MLCCHLHLDLYLAFDCEEPCKHQSNIHAKGFCPTYPSASSKVKSLAHGHLRKVNIQLSLVYALSSKFFMHGLLRNTLIVQVGFLCNIEAIGFAGDDLQECRTTTALVSNILCIFCAELLAFPAFPAP